MSGLGSHVRLYSMFLRAPLFYMTQSVAGLFEKTLCARNERKVRCVRAYEEMSEVLTVNLELEQLETDVFSPRKTFSENCVEELSESIEREGQPKPIIVRVHLTKPNVYQVIDEEHRIRTLRKLGYGLLRKWRWLYRLSGYTRLDYDCFGYSVSNPLLL